MDGFRVDLAALSQSGAGFKKAGGELATVSRRLASLRGKLATQEFPALNGILEQIDSAAKLSEKSSVETLDYGDMCSEISEAYEMAERQVLQMVNALGTMGAAGFLGTAARSSGGATLSPRAVMASGTPAIMSSDRLQGEEWLVNRAINDLEERGVFT